MSLFFIVNKYNMINKKAKSSNKDLAIFLSYSHSIVAGGLEVIS